MRVGSVLSIICLLAVAIVYDVPSSPAVVAGRDVTGKPFLVIADSQQGEGVFKSKCSICHSVLPGGATKVGPNLHGLFGRKAGTLSGYNYSTAMQNSGIVWSAQTLDDYLTNPHKDIPGDKMPFPGLPDKADRDNLISYLEQATQ
jgi:cytochrome c